MKNSEEILSHLSVMGQAEQFINQLETEKTIFTSDERNLIVNYAYKTNDMDKTRELAEKLAYQIEYAQQDVGLTVIDAQAEIDAFPDSMIGISDMMEYGYTWYEMLPLTQKKALELFDHDFSVYLLHEDDSETTVYDRKQILEHNGIFGIEKGEWDNHRKLCAILEQNNVVAEFQEKTGNMFHDIDGLNSKEIEKLVKYHVLGKIDEYNIDARIEDIIVSGSRCRGLETEKSDLDIVISFSGSEREDDFFFILNHEKMYIGNVEVDFNPINTEKTGTLAEYLSGVEIYLSEKSIEVDRSYKEKSLELLKKYGYELVAEQGENHDFTLIRPIGEELAFGFDGWQMIHDYFCDVDTLIEKNNSISELQNRLEGDISKIPLGIADEQLRAAIRYLSSECYADKKTDVQENYNKQPVNRRKAGR